MTELIKEGHGKDAVFFLIYPYINFRERELKIQRNTNL
jgi:hypothetical protein